MPSRHAHRHALRRSKEPLVIPPQELAALPLLPADHGWRNPVRGDDYDRNTWEAYRSAPHDSATLATVQRSAGGFAVYLGSVLNPPAYIGCVDIAFETAAAHSRAWKRGEGDRSSRLLAR